MALEAMLLQWFDKLNPGSIGARRTIDVEPIGYPMEKREE
jgi:hypothetical protein